MIISILIDLVLGLILWLAVPQLVGNKTDTRHTIQIICKLLGILMVIGAALRLLGALAH